MFGRLSVLASALFAVAAFTAFAQNAAPVNPGQDPGQTSSGASATNGGAGSQPAARKVWTNEDVPTLRGNAPISTVGSTDTKPAGTNKGAAKNPNGRGYQARIARLEAQIPPLDAQMADLQSAIDGKPTGNGSSSQRPRGVKADDWNAELQQLKAKRENILDQIAVLKDEARHQGVPPNTLP